MKTNALASLALAFATAYALADNLGTPTKVGSLSRSTDYVYTADQTDTLLGARVPTSRTVNGKPLSADVVLYAADILDSGGTSIQADFARQDGRISGAIAYTTAVSNKLESSISAITIPPAFQSVSGTSGSADADATHTAIVFTGSNISADVSSGTPGAIVALSVPTGSISAKGVVQLSSATNSTSATLAATPAAVKGAIDAAKAYTDAKAYKHPTYTARTGKPTANATPSFGGTFTVSQITSDATGHVTGATDRTITIPSAVATTSAPGLMSAADKTALDSLAAGGVTKAAVAAALQAQGISSADAMDDMDTLAAKVAAIIAVLEALD